MSEIIDITAWIIVAIFGGLLIVFRRLQTGPGDEYLSPTRHEILERGGDVHNS